eukprot:TRINITY_DN2585_c0_g4_i1.p1 TRINITY_DN2585_c0_g4~~TRINITY_DN2585_c0_g4_i1.p1  ORF type:complete len:147 (-),score=18.56 TRINITY_DN2585_c0_g4_i1:8-448(-)
MSDKQAEQPSKQSTQELISRLICRLAECKYPEEHFMRFADTLKQAFPDLCHMSITVLPENQKAREQLKAITPEKQRKYILNKLKGESSVTKPPSQKNKYPLKNNDIEKTPQTNNEKISFQKGGKLLDVENKSKKVQNGQNQNASFW